MNNYLTDPLALAVLFHVTYEKLAPRKGYETRTETRVFDPESPNGKLMVATCEEIQKVLRDAVGLGSANLDTQLAALAAFIDTEIAGEEIQKVLRGWLRV